MSRPLAFASAAVLSLFLAAPTWAEGDHDHEDEAHESHDHAEDAHDGEDEEHLSEVAGLRLLHGWVAATDRPPARIFFEIDNERETAVTLVGASSDLGDLQLMGAPILAGGDPQPLDPLPIPAGSEFELTPDAVYLELDGFEAPLVEGDHVDLVVLFEGEEIELHVEVLDAGATSHPHAGHNH